jgi:hypothetical protein
MRDHGEPFTNRNPGMAAPMCRCGHRKGEHGSKLGWRRRLPGRVGPCGHIWCECRGYDAVID